METWWGHCILGLALSMLTTFPQFARGAPAYTTRHPRQEPPCKHRSHATLCWTVQLKPPLHFQLTPITSSLQDSDTSADEPSVDRVNQQHLWKASKADSALFPLKTSNFSEADHYAYSDTAVNDSSQWASSSFSSQSDVKSDSSSSVPNKSSLKNRSIPASTSKLKPDSFRSGQSHDTDSHRQGKVTDTSEPYLQKMETLAETPHHQKVYVYHQMALLLAQEVGLSLLGKVGELYDHFVLCHEGEVKGGSGPESSHGSAKAFQHYHKAHTDLKNVDTARFEEVNHVEFGMDINVTGVWNSGITGKGITVAVVDDGLEWNNPDLHDSYNFLGSWDLNDNDPDPMPNAAKVSNHHGTRCAGEIAAVANNNVCGVGVAYGAKVAGIRLLDGPMTDSLEAEAFNKKFDINAVYSCSWGPDDDGKTVDGPHILAAKAMKYGVEFGRHGYGSVFVVASGNGGSKQDNCNYDGYANSIYTVTIGAVDESGSMPYYAEQCASMLGVTFSSGIASKRDIVTTDWHQKGGTGCTERHTGTSAAAPLAAGMIALMLDAQPCLTWRDVQYILIITSVKIERDLVDWYKNGAGLEHSHKHGFGLISAWRMVNAARVWRSVPWMTSYSEEDTTGWHIPHGVNNPLIVRHTVTPADIAGYSLYMLEYVQVTVTLSHPVRGKLGIHLRCPSGTLSVIGAPRPNDNSTEGFTDWTFTTVRCWGEAPTGDWTLVILDSLPADSNLPIGHLTKWRLTLFGTPMTTEEFKERQLEVEKAMNGEYLNTNFTPQCDPPPVTSPPYIPLSEKTLKILFLASVFCVVFALYETLEYMLCYGEEKRQQAEEAQRAMTQQCAQMSSESSAPETARLLSNESERDAEWLQQSQSAFEEEEDDMFLLDAGTAARMRQSRHAGRLNGTGVSTGERIHMSTFRMSTARSLVRDSPQEGQSLLGIGRPAPSADHTAVSGALALNGDARPIQDSPNHFDPTASRSGVQGHMQMATEAHSEANRSDRGLARDSILPEMWKSLTQDRESDSDSLEEELFSRGNESNVSLLHNGVKKSYR